MIITLFYDTRNKAGWADVIFLHVESETSYLLTTSNNYLHQLNKNYKSIPDLWESYHLFDIHSTYTSMDDLQLRQPSWYNMLKEKIKWMDQSKKKI